MTEIEARLLEYLKSIDNRDKKAVLQSIALFLGYARKKAQQNRQRRQAQENAPETTNAPETPAPLVVIPTPVEPVEKKPLDTLEILPTDDDDTKMRKLLARQAKERARCNNNVVQNDEDILRGKIKPDTDF